ncbi:cutinase family protein [Streptomyces pluripotens]|uniref:Cutinase family protein n=1 Tax=Streptomyces pluripotens TaxID=1355015 RepID=A0A221P1I3_9ACTN|nr:hypothetical protein LK06_019455 [Streptomyces pluripotens]ASN26012.1 cutinase family protein [Streptomyces pluripotens]
MRILLLCMAMLCGSLGLTIFGPVTSAKADPACMKNGGVYVVFARGSGESFDGAQARAFKTSVLSILASYEAPRAWVELGNLDNAQQPQDQLSPGRYPAVGWADWGILTGMDGYYDSVWTGVSELVTHLNDRASRCPRESIVVGGYSQGAEVVGYAMNSISDYTRSHIGYVALYGDPRSTACNMVVRVPWARGDANCALGSLRIRVPYVPSSLADRTGSWCDKRDGICTGNKAYLPVAGNPLSTHGSAYQDHWIPDPDSALEIVNKAFSKLGELSSIQIAGPSYTITPPDTSADSPAAPPPPPTVKSLKRTTDSSGTPQVYAATQSAITEAWWHPGGDGVHTSEVIHIAQDNIVGFDKVNLPEGKQAVYTAVPDGIWETWWDAQHSPGSAKIISGLSGVRSVIAANRWEGGQYVHRLYVLASDGPYEFWWKDGDPEGIHKSRLVNINNPVTMVKSTGPDGEDQLYVASAGWVYEIWWKSEGVKYGTILNISQGDINSLSKTLVSGEQRLFTGTSTSVWQSKWNGSTAPAHSAEVSGRTGIIHSQAMRTGSAYQIYIATTGGVREFWYTSSGAGNSNVVNRSQQGDISTFVKFNDGAAQQIYTGTNRGEVYETWWGGGTSPTTSKLFEVAR